MSRFGETEECGVEVARWRPQGFRMKCGRRRRLHKSRVVNSGLARERDAGSVGWLEARASGSGEKRAWKNGEQEREVEELEGKRTLSPRTKQEASAGGLRQSLSEDGGGRALG